MNDTGDFKDSEHKDMDTHSANQPGTTNSSGVGSANPPFAANSSRIIRRPKPARASVPTDVEIIDLDELPESTRSVKVEFDDEVMFIKSEPIESLKPFCSWSNTVNNAIVIDDDDDPPPAHRLLRQHVKESKNTQTSASRRLENVPIPGISTPLALTPLRQQPITTTTPIEDNMDVDATEAIRETLSADPIKATTLSLLTTEI